MNMNLVLNLLDLAVALTQSQLEGSDIEDGLLEIIRAAAKSYYSYTGQPVNVSYILPEEAL